MIVLKNVPFLKSKDFSPWPERITGKESFHRSARTPEQIQSEYNEGWHKQALDKWNEYVESNTTVRPSRFYRSWDNFILQSMFATADVYGVSKDEHLISVNQELFAANWSSVTALYDNLLVDVVERYVDQFGAKTLVELGCGSGRNLFKLYEKVGIQRLVGGDICSNAVTLGKCVSETCSIDGEFQIFDFYAEDCVTRITDGITDEYLLMTSHAIEQVQVEKTSIVEQILALPVKPAAVIHFEPLVHRDDTSFFRRMHRSYTEMNSYNTDLLEVIRHHESQGAVEVLDCTRSVIGTAAFNPTSVLVWRCT